MLRKRSILRHELLNIVTVLHFLLLEEGSVDKEKSADLLRKMTMLIAHEKFFLGGKVDFFKQYLSIKDITDTVVAVTNTRIKNKDFLISNECPDIDIFIDRYYMEEALKLLMEKIIEEGNLLKFSYDMQSNSLKINYEGVEFEPDNKQSLMACLNKKTIYNGDVGISLAFKMLKSMGLKIEAKTNLLEVKF